MRVLFLLETNQLSHTAVEVIRTYRDHGADVLFVTMLARSDLHTAVESLGVPATSLDVGSSRSYPRASWSLSRLIKSHNSQVLHGVEPVPGSLVAGGGLIARRGLRVFHRQHSVARWPQSGFSRVAARGCNLVIACSEAAGAMSIEDGTPARKLRVVHNGVPAPRPVEPGEASDLRASFGIPDDAIVLSTVARLRPEKGIDVALRALETIVDDLDHPVHYVIVGDGPEADSLMAAAEGSAATVHFAGFQSDVAPWLAIADMMLMPSRYDAAPLAAAEAMGAGRPIVASRTGGLVEMVADGESGVLVEPGSVAELASAVIQLARDPDKRARMGRTAAERFEDGFSVDRMVCGCIAAYREML